MKSPYALTLALALASCSGTESKNLLSSSVCRANVLNPNPLALRFA